MSTGIFNFSAKISKKSEQPTHSALHSPQKDVQVKAHDALHLAQLHALALGQAGQRTAVEAAQLGQLGAWQKEAVLAARLAPSAINQQPWKIVADKTSVSILETTVLYKKYAPLDRGICMLHAAVGAAKAGRTGLWKKVDGGYAMKA